MTTDPGARPQEWLCPVCGAVIADDQVADEDDLRHEHYGRAVELVPRPPAGGPLTHPVNRPS
jgi:hypothetical protein